LDQQRQSSSQAQDALSSENQWYVLIGEQQYGPLRLGHLAMFAQQGRLQRDNWVWKPGLDAWTPAGDVPGLFAEASQFRDETMQLNRSVVEESTAPETKHGFKDKAKDQIRNFTLMFLYLWVVFGMLAIHESIILAQHQIAYVSHGLALVNALIFAKVMLVAEDLHLGHRLDDKPLVYSILFKSLLFGITLICFHIVEHVLIGMWHGEPVAESISKIGADNLEGMVSIGIIATVALIPFFILREISRAMGQENFFSFFFQRRYQ
jgi:hypothetical protein